MSKWLVISDNHGDVEILSKMQAALQPDVIFHCGDSEMAHDDPWFQGVHVVQGNMDYDSEFPLVATPTIDGLKVLLTHGHYDAVHWDLTKLSLHADEERADVVFFGHTHELAVEVSDGHLFVNPGSISQPRGEFRRLGGTCALLTVDDQQVKVQYYTRDGQPVPDLAFVYQRSQF